MSTATPFDTELPAPLDEVLSKGGFTATLLVVRDDGHPLSDADAEAVTALLATYTSDAERAARTLERLADIFFPDGDVGHASGSNAIGDACNALITEGYAGRALESRLGQELGRLGLAETTVRVRTEEGGRMVLACGGEEREIDGDDCTELIEALAELEPGVSVEAVGARLLNLPT
jgi:hypothetical protein